MKYYGKIYGFSFKLNNVCCLRYPVITNVELFSTDPLYSPGNQDMGNGSERRLLQVIDTGFREGTGKYLRWKQFPQLPGIGLVRL